MREKTHTTNTHTQTFKSSSCFQFSAHKHHRSVHNHTNSDVDVVKPNTNLMSAALPRTVRCSHTCICCLYLFINSLRPYLSVWVIVVHLYARIRRSLRWNLFAEYSVHWKPPNKASRLWHFVTRKFQFIKKNQIRSNRKVRYFFNLVPKKRPQIKSPLSYMPF